MKILIDRTKLPPALGLLLWIFSIAASPAQYTNGIYAEFNTSMGNFTNRLEYTLAPKTCANFIGLATGQRSWLDLVAGVTHTTPYYNGQIIHRVVTNFIIQGGSPNGTGTDGPGYSFQDEFTPSLRHDSFGTLSMANSGPDSNGSQYFLTVASTPSLDDVHTVFGKLYGGSNVVYAISRTPSDGNSKPLVNVNVNSVTIRRVGAAALAFDVNAYALPLVTNLNLKAARLGNNMSITFSNRLSVDNRIYASSNLVNWVGTKLGIETAPGFTSQLLVNPTGKSGFYRMTQIQYPGTLYTPASVVGKSFTFTFTQGTSGVVSTYFAGAGTGLYSIGGGPADYILGYNYLQDAYRGRIYGLFGANLPYMDLHLAYTSATGGTFRGTFYLAGNLAVGGTFTSSP